jgi:Ca-activated chloride channel family protein
MQKLLYVTLLLLLSIAVPAQSGRKVKTAPAPQGQPESSSPQDEYSESTPQPKRTFYPPRLRKDKDKDNGIIAAPKTDTSATAPTSVGDEDVIKVTTDLVTIPVSVYDHNGLYVPNLRRTDFKIFADGKEQEIAYFGSSDKPFTVVLMIDTSPSTAYRIEEIQDAARAFVDQLQPQDSVMVVEFAYNVHMLTDVTKDRSEIYNALRKTRFGDGTSLYEAVDFSLHKKLSHVEGRKAIVLFTDGVDTTSRRATYDSTLAEAEESEAPIFPIYYNTYFDGRSQTTMGIPGDVIGPPQGGIFGGGRQPAGSSSADYARGRAYLEDLASYTGGRMYRPESTAGGLTAAFEGIAQELRSQYSIGFIPKDEGKAGERKAIKVRINRSGLAIRARDSYIVGEQAKTTTAATPKPSN